MTDDQSGQRPGAPASLPAISFSSAPGAARDGGAPRSNLKPSFVPASRETSRVVTSVRSPEPHLGWHSRGFLPHWDHPAMIQSVGFRLHDSLPKQVLEKWRLELRLTELRSYRINQKQKNHPGEVGACAELKKSEIELRKRIARYEDEGHGSCCLRIPQIGQLVENALLRFDADRYRLLAWCVMPNHVHVCFECLEGYPMADVLHSWKSFTGNKANEILGKRGEFWQRDYLDRYIRNSEHYCQAISYIENNPVKAGLVRQAAGWVWSSAKFRVDASASVAAISFSLAPEVAARDGGAPREGPQCGCNS